jgi:exonuclease III
MNNTARQEKLRQTINIHKPDLICIQETKMYLIDSATVRR